MPFQWCSNEQKNAPALAASVSVTPNATPNANSSWVTLFTAAADSVLTEVMSYVPGSAQGFFIDIGVDTGGGPAVIATTIGYWWFNNTPGWGRMPFRIPIDAIPSGAVVKIRMRKPDTSTTAWFFSCQYVEKPIVGTVLTSTHPQQASAFAALTNNSTAWTYGSWATVHTFTNAAVITGLALGVDGEWIVQLGIGGVPLLTARARGGFDFKYDALKHPLAVAAGAVVQARIQQSITGADTRYLGLTYLEL